MTAIGLESIATHFPDATIKRGDYAYPKDALPEGMEAPAEKRRLVRKDAAEFLAEKAAAKALDKAGLEPADIDLIIAENIGGQYIIPVYVVSPYGTTSTKFEETLFCSLLLQSILLISGFVPFSGSWCET